jgi:hypothetical protein
MRARWQCGYTLVRWRQDATPSYLTNVSLSTCNERFESVLGNGTSVCTLVHSGGQQRCAAVAGQRRYRRTVVHGRT